MGRELAGNYYGPFVFGQVITMSRRRSLAMRSAGGAMGRDPAWSVRRNIFITTSAP